MNPQLIILSQAEEELQAAHSWYESQHPGLGEVFLAATDEALDRIRSSPSPSVVAPGTSPDLGARAVFMKQFPYSVIFFPEPSCIWVVAFAHQRRKPGYWRSR